LDGLVTDISYREKEANSSEICREVKI